MAKKDKQGSSFNYAGPGAVVGIQAGNVTIGGSIRLGGDDVTIDDPVTADDDDD